MLEHEYVESVNIGMFIIYTVIYLAIAAFAFYWFVIEKDLVKGVEQDRVYNDIA
jgi:hypothetical protein